MAGSELEELRALLTALAGTIRQAKPLPMSASVRINRAEVLAILERAKTLIPASEQPDEIAAPGVADTLAQARQHADEIRAAARKQAETLLEHTDSVTAANERARELEAAGKARADALVRGAQEYCDKALAQLEDSLHQILTQVNSGRQVLARQLHEHAAQTDESDERTP
ncbi:MAG: hypothetical protein Q4Q03_07660 [Bowdeniella nasicola]|nr:hypothetical protein [Bowdeniella nasicola]